MANWSELPDVNQGDSLAYAEAWENRVPDVEYADEDEAGQLGLGVPGEQRAIPTLARPVDVERCACGRELENGEHGGGYGAWCG